MAIEAALAGASALTQLSQLSTLAADIAVNIAEKWYEASNNLEEFRKLEREVKRNITEWAEELRNAGMADDRKIKELLSDAINAFETEKIKMDTVQSNCCLFRFMYWSKAQSFPAHLKSRLKEVVDALNNIPNVMEERANRAREVEEIADRLPEAHHIFVDNRIVPLSQTQDEVMQRLQDKEGDQVVTLYGGAGSGKTSLAKSLALQYQENRGYFADGALFLSCGNNATAESICNDLFQSLGISDGNTNAALDTKIEQSAKSKGTPSEGQFQSCLKKLPRRLRGRHLLIVLDDVSDDEILKGKLIVPQAKHVKYLITSKQKNIYDGATMIHMEPPTHEEAVKVLCKYIPNFRYKGEIPQSLQEKVNQIIQKADKNPKRLATIGREIDYFDDETSWDYVLDNFDSLLVSNKHTQGDNDTMSRSIRMEIDYLNSHCEAQKLLYLMALCEPRNVPEVVLQLLFQHIEPNHSSTFKTHMKILKDRDLISVQENDVVLSSPYQYFISTLFAHRKEFVSELLCSLMKEGKNHDDTELIRALCVLYVVSKEDAFTDEATSALKEVAMKFNIFWGKKNIISIVREAVKPLLYYLLVTPSNGKECEVRRHRLASKAIKRFVSKQELDDTSFTILLDEKDIYEDICGVLRTLASVPRNSNVPLLTKDMKRTLEELIFNLHPTSEDIETTLDTLSELSHEANCDFILEDDRVLKNLFEILQSDDQDEKVSVLSCLRGLAQSSTTKLKMVSYEGLIEAIVAIFCEDSDISEEGHLTLKVCSIKALGQIGFQEKTSTILLEIPNLLTSIAQLLEDIYFKDREKDFIWGYGHWAANITIECLSNMLQANDDNEAYFKEHEDLIQVLTKIFETYNDDNTCYENSPEEYYTGDDIAASTLFILTIINPTQYNNNKVILHSKATYISRGDANIFCRLYKEAFFDYKQADRRDKCNDLFYKETLCFCKAMLKDYEGALWYVTMLLEDNQNNSFIWQERGVVKELMEDYAGSKEDLNHALNLSPTNYECLKHRAYVNFKLDCIEEAHEDAKQALQLIPNFEPYYGRRNVLGTLPVPKFFDYNFR